MCWCAGVRNPTEGLSGTLSPRRVRCGLDRHVVRRLPEGEHLPQRGAASLYEFGCVRHCVAENVCAVRWGKVLVASSVSHCYQHESMSCGERACEVRPVPIAGVCLQGNAALRDLHEQAALVRVVVQVVGVRLCRWAGGQQEDCERRLCGVFCRKVRPPERPKCFIGCFSFPGQGCANRRFRPEVAECIVPSSKELVSCMAAPELSGARQDGDGV